MISLAQNSPTSISELVKVVIVLIFDLQIKAKKVIGCTNGKP